MSRKLVLHIGTHKTGTTAIQNTLAANRTALGRQGYVYPLASMHFKGVQDSRNAYFLGRLVKDAVKPGSIPADKLQLAQTCRREIAAYADAPEDVILSDERLWYSSTGYARYWDALRACLEGMGFAEFRIIVYLRRQDRFAEALWNQFVKGDTRLTDSLATYLASDTVSRICNYAEGLDALAAVFGKKALSVRIFDRAQMTGADVVPDFLDTVGVDSSDFADLREKERNVRLSNDAVEVKRLINASPAYRSLPNFMSAPLLEYSSAHPESGKTNLLPATERARFLARFEKGNAYVAREYLGIPDSVLFGPEKADGYPDWDPCSESLRQALAFALDELFSRNSELHGVTGRGMRGKGGGKGLADAAHSLGSRTKEAVKRALGR